MTRLVAIQSLILSVLALALNRMRGAPLVPLAGERLLGACAAALALGAATVAFSRVGARRFEWLARLEAHIRRMLGPLGRGEIAAIALVGPLGEELFFRGMLQPALGSALRAPVAGLALATLLFAALHTVPDRGGELLWAWTAFALVLGAALGALFLATGSILPPLVLHATVNAGNLVRIARPAGRA